MRNFLKTMKSYICNRKRVHYRDRRGHYASSGLKCLRDQYWEMKDETPTDKTDFVGYMRMSVGSAVEEYVIKAFMSKMHMLGYHMLGSQVPVGTSDPNIDGYLDVLMAEKVGDEYHPFVVEIKTKQGFGADMLLRTLDPSPDYLSQLGVYLKEMHEKGVTSHGMLFYILLSNDNYGHVLQIECAYDPETSEIVAYHAQSTTGIDQNINHRYKVTNTIERFKQLEGHLERGEVPAADYKYKEDLTPEVVSCYTDTKIKSILSGRSVGGDWQPRYSKYFTKQLEVDGLSRERSTEELNLLLCEWRRRHPKSRMTKLTDFRK